jgi:hypothetical protein
MYSYSYSPIRYLLHRDACHQQQIPSYEYTVSIDSKVLGAAKKGRVPAEFEQEQPELAALVTRMLHPDPTCRISVGELLAASVLQAYLPHAMGSGGSPLSHRSPQSEMQQRQLQQRQLRQQQHAVANEGAVITPLQVPQKVPLQVPQKVPLERVPLERSLSAPDGPVPGHVRRVSEPPSPSPVLPPFGSAVAIDSTSRKLDHLSRLSPQVPKPQALTTRAGALQRSLTQTQQRYVASPVFHTVQL